MTQSRVTENPKGVVPRVKIRGFEVAEVHALRATMWDVRLPERATANSAAYDFFAPTDIFIHPAREQFAPPALVPTGVKAYMRPHEVLILANRSSHPKKGLLLANGIGVIDADYYSNPDNDGHIMFAFFNVGNETVVFRKGDKIGQGFFTAYMRADGDAATGERRGGFGSTDI